MENFENAKTELELPSVMDMVAAPPLLEALIQRRGEPLSIDGAGVQRLGAQCLQVLLAARAAWAADEQELRLQNCSDDFLATLELFGVDAVTLTYAKEMS